MNSHLPNRLRDPEPSRLRTFATLVADGLGHVLAFVVALL
jgi:hypothetical protein